MEETKQFIHLKFNAQLKNQIQTAKQLLRSALTSIAGKVTTFTLKYKNLRSNTH